MNCGFEAKRYAVFFADLFTESRTLRKRRQPNSTVTVTERRRKPVTVSDILAAAVISVEQLYKQT